ncbi:MAG TPA: hypothetical protein DGR79_03820 [Clostridiales bacterium]|nr:hypothetical protein [Clostridiales bacterium]
MACLILICSAIAYAAIPMWGSISIKVVSGPTAPNGEHSVRSYARSHTGGPNNEVDELSLNLYLWQEWTLEDHMPVCLEEAWLIEEFVAYDGAEAATKLDAEKRAFLEWQAFYQEAIAKCQEAGLKTYRWDALLNGTVAEFSKSRAAALAWTYQSVEGFQTGDAYPLVAVRPDGRMVIIHKIAGDLTRTTKIFAWQGQAWVAQNEDEHARTLLDTED